MASDYEIVALRVVMGTATVQHKVSDLKDETALKATRKKIAAYAGKCFDEAVEKAKIEWQTLKKASEGFNGAIAKRRRPSPSADQTASSVNSQAKRRSPSRRS